MMKVIKNPWTASERVIHQKQRTPEKWIVSNPQNKTKRHTHLGVRK
jgi:hypothetical protein